MFVGGVGGNRTNIVNGLAPDLLEHVQPNPQRSYSEMARMICERRFSVNCAWTGSGATMHVKGRVIEAGFAGCCLFENRGSPTGDWFEPTLEYFPYDNAGEIRRMLQEKSDEELETVAQRFQKKVIQNHHPSVFWNKVLSKLGFEVG